MLLAPTQVSLSSVHVGFQTGLAPRGEQRCLGTEGGSRLRRRADTLNDVIAAKRNTHIPVVSLKLPVSDSDFTQTEQEAESMWSSILRAGSAADGACSPS